jgi:hypothetical protein
LYIYAARGNLDQRAAEAGEEEARQEVRGEEEEEEEEESDDEFCDRTTAPVPKWEVLAGNRAVWVQLYFNSRGHTAGTGDSSPWRAVTRETQQHIAKQIR